MMHLRIPGLACICLFALSAGLFADDFGDFTGQVVLDGEIPTLPLLVKKGDASVKDAAVCAAQDLADQSLVVNEKTKGVANVVVYLQRAPSKIHPDLKMPAEAKVVFDQKACTFEPHVMVVNTQQKVQVISADGVAHNTRSAPVKNQGFNFIVAPNDREGVEVNLPIAESLPMKLTCDIHPWMSAYWMVVDHPYAAVTDADGKFTIKGLPAGEHKFIVWHERPGYINGRRDPLEVKIEGGKETSATIKVLGTKLK
jgi:hypothetical protein